METIERNTTVGKVARFLKRYEKIEKNEQGEDVVKFSSTKHTYLSVLTRYFNFFYGEQGILEEQVEQYFSTPRDYEVDLEARASRLRSTNPNYNSINVKFV